ncbi:hypothetical protein AC249_AIPGENE18902 [Exaiptasia diaphana]|nr:hypothetical protein AC249_AIPGENE18902 [Exaiptasia diaphana]
MFTSLTGHRRDLKKGSIPSIFKWKKEVPDHRGVRLEERTKRIETNKKENFIKITSQVEPIQYSSQHSGLNSVEDAYIPQLQNEIKELEEQITALKLEIFKSKERERMSKFDLERFSGSDEDINFYTGFADSQTLLKLGNYINSDASKLIYYSYVRDRTDSISSVDTFPYLNKMSKKFDSHVGAKHSLNPVDEFWLFLYRILLGLFKRDLAHRFNISVSSVSDIIITWSNFLYVVLRSFPCWSTRQKIKEHLPEAFKGRFESITYIIDCTEIKVEKPLCLEAQSELYSEYKSHNTYKELVGISPNAWVTFVSQLYGGSISDRELVEKSHLIDLLEPPDLIMADRGFDIQDLLAHKRVKLYIPPKRQSTQDQFSKEECFETMSIANVRIHVERAIRRVKGWHIFDQVLPLAMNGVVNQIWTVCSLLVNWQKTALTG